MLTISTLFLLGAGGGGGEDMKENSNSFILFNKKEIGISWDIYET